MTENSLPPPECDDRLSWFECILLFVGSALVLAFFVFPQSLVDTFTYATKLPPELLGDWADSRNQSRFLSRLERNMRFAQGGVLLASFLAASLLKGRVRLRHATGVLFVLAVLIRQLAIGDITGDEARTWHNFIQPGPWAALGYFPAPNNHILASLLGALIGVILPSKPLILLAFSLLSSVGVYGLAKLLKDLGRSHLEILLAMLLFATHAMLVDAGAQLRGYGPMIALIPFLWYQYRQLSRQEDSEASCSMAKCAFTGALVVGFHLYGAFVLLGLLVHYVIWQRSRPLGLALKGLGLFLGLFALIYGLTIKSLWEYLQKEGDAARYQGFDGGRVLDYLAAGQPWLWAGIALGLWSYVRSQPQFLVLILAPFGLASLFGVLTNTFVFPRFFSMALPSFILLLAAGSSWGSKDPRRIPRGLSLVFLASALALTWAPLPKVIADSNARDQLVDYVEQREPEAIYIAGRFAPSVQFYLPSASPVLDVQTLKEAPGNHVIVAERGRKRWAENLPSLARYIQENYREVWRPINPEKAASSLSQCSVLVLRRRVK